ncbi:hypothetical protein AB205_0167620 [Aquarana catesbeiana]|uniref:Uncharacterized protein n=1 Tax=Aquarana catesbeiana TaxID=8400 RepID=A0A2G9Q3Y4_AQUCT|nr:hypothetical protein AB205_0167620 [Aquarana catesbeiana]
MYKYFTVPPATFQKLKRRGMQWIPSLRKRKTWELTSKVPKKTRPPNLQQQPRLKDNVCLFVLLELPHRGPGNVRDIPNMTWMQPC